MVAKLDYKDIKHLVSKKDYRNTETKNNIGIEMFGYENMSNSSIKKIM